MGSRNAGYFEHSGIQSLSANLQTIQPNDLPSDIEAMVLLAQSSHFREFPARADEVFDVNVTADRHLAKAAALRIGRVPVFQMTSGEPIDYVADITLAKSLLALRPISFLEGLAATIDAI